MTNSGPTAARDVSSARCGLDRPRSGLFCLGAWLVATAIFFGMVALLGGPTQNDATESIYGTWAISHGSLACAYPPASAVTNSFIPSWSPLPAAPPLWPYISGGIAALTRLGHMLPFPSLGANCADAYEAMYQWSGTTRTFLPTVGLGYASWFFLLAGFVALLRASGRGRTGWEALGIVFLALVPIMWMPLLDEYHPQDLVALGLALGGVACAERREWVSHGCALGVGCHVTTIRSPGPRPAHRGGSDEGAVEIDRFGGRGGGTGRSPLGRGFIGASPACGGGGNRRLSNLRRHAPLGTSSSRPCTRLRRSGHADPGRDRFGLVVPPASRLPRPRARPPHLASRHVPQHETGLRGGPLRVQVHGSGRDAHRPGHRASGEFEV